MDVDITKLEAFVPSVATFTISFQCAFVKDFKYTSSNFIQLAIVYVVKIVFVYPK
jgi:hypothetical protein